MTDLPLSLSILYSEPAYPSFVRALMALSSIMPFLAMSGRSELSRFTVSVMVVEVFSSWPASGVCFSTFHFLSWSFVSGVTVIVSNPAFSRVVLASDTVWPTVLGMGSDGVNMYPLTQMASRTMMVRPHQRLHHGFFALYGFPPLPPPYGGVAGAYGGIAPAGGIMGICCVGMGAGPCCLFIVVFFLLVFFDGLSSLVS